MLSSLKLKKVKGRIVDVSKAFVPNSHKARLSNNLDE